MARAKKKKIIKPSDTPQSAPLVAEAKTACEMPAPQSESPERGRFILEKVLGRGGVCEVYEALDLLRAGLSDTHPKVALKKLRPEFREEAAAQLALAGEFVKCRALAHPGVIGVYDLHRQGGELCLSMELVEAPTLKERLRRGPELTPLEARQTAGKIFEILAHIHERGLVHADVKPGNIFLKSGQPIIFDFNASRVLPQAGQTATLQALAEAKIFPAATVIYAAPERLRGAAPSQADDIFSAAVTVYEMLCGRHPFGRRSALEAALEGLAPQRPQLLSRRQWHYLSLALSFEAERRPTASALARAYAAHPEGRLSRAALLLDDLRHQAMLVLKTLSDKVKFLIHQKVKNGPA